MNKTQLINDLMRREGWDKYTNDPDDKGGPTKWGITEQVAREYGYTGDMEDMPYAVAFGIYSDIYWDKPQIEAILDISGNLALYLFDFGVNSGTWRAAEYLQRLLNSLNREETDYADLVTDGIIGIKTIKALQSFVNVRKSKGLEVLTEVYNGLRISFLFHISEQDKTQEKFTYGWFKRVVEL